MRSKCGTIARQRKAKRLGQTIHRIGREHARARAASGAGGTLNHIHLCIRIFIISSSHHGIHQIQRLDFASGCQIFAGLHRPARNEHRRNVKPHRSHQHARGNFIAIGNAHHCVSTMGIDHILDTVGNNLARGQGVKHSVMAHGNAVINRNGVEFLGHATSRLNLTRHQLPQILQMHMARHKLGEAVHHSNDRLAKIAILHASGAP